MPVGFRLEISFFLGKEFTNWFAWIFKCRILRIDTNLCDNGDNRCTHEATLAKLFTECVLKVIANVSLAHSYTDRERSVWLCLIFVGKRSHSVVDHTYLWSISVNHNYLVTFLNKVAERLCSRFYCYHLFWKCISKCVAAKGNHDTFSFIYHKNLL